MNMKIFEYSQHYIVCFSSQRNTRKALKENREEKGR